MRKALWIVALVASLLVVALGAAMATGGWKLITVLGRLDTEPRVLTRSPVRGVR